ncbi:NAD(P)-binding protein [Exidia glandulosa HHB12029]|uniref:NAD(P)-binding protein n=1 Tax=Exidia glandulosa HHB12029 TaxID=1314781 RepID=A0A165LGS6_EXIGL|nr:NAD(P)-binding protein [Exidia glandulosa HHB12029]
MVVAVGQKSALITGCTAGGIGHALALEFYKQGFRVFATARRLDAIQDLHDKGLETVALDVTEDTSVKAAAAHVADLTGGTLDVLVNNAGQGYREAATDFDVSRAQAAFDTNLFGVMRMVRDFAPLLVKAKGKILNVGSVAGLIPSPFRSIYSATKAALHSYGDSLRLEMKSFDVTVVTLMTGGVTTKMSTKPPPSEGIIPPESLYWPAAEVINDLYSNQADNAMSPAEYARRIVAFAQSSKDVPWFWEGNFATAIWFMTTFLSKKALEGILGRAIKGMAEMESLIRGAKSS